ncbi:hypothetical protein [Heyndrickxia coagulans]|uniref:hypothetical protein n=1 Tax=Heyndrickxia coagulans TaxID=1398 RepID=UPI0006288B42|nr:hypothetical protein [Heyndrickxia coagulans]
MTSVKKMKSFLLQCFKSAELISLYIMKSSPGVKPPGLWVLAKVSKNLSVCPKGTMASKKKMIIFLFRWFKKSKPASLYILKQSWG